MYCSEYAINDPCKLNTYCKECEVSKVNTNSRERIAVDYDNLFYNVDPNKCILCKICIRVCDELQGRSALEIYDNSYVRRKDSSDELADFQCEDRR